MFTAQSIRFSLSPPSFVQKFPDGDYYFWIAHFTTPKSYFIYIAHIYFGVNHWIHVYELPFCFVFASMLTKSTTKDREFSHLYANLADLMDLP